MKKYTVIPLGALLSQEYDQKKIEEAFKKFSCQREADLENFLMRKAIPYERTNFGKTFLLIDLDELEKHNFLVMAYYRNLLGGLYRENPVKSRNYEAVKSSKKWENVGNSYIIPALLLYRYSYI